DGSGNVWPAAWPGLIDTGQRVQLGFIAVIDGRVAAGTVAVVDADVSYRSSGGPPLVTTAHSEVTIAARGGVPLFVWFGAPARGPTSIIAAHVPGNGMNGLRSRLQRAIWVFDRTHREALSRWNGDLATLGSADAALRSVLAPKYRAAVPT